MSSAIELYKEAYDLDFNKGESLYAETLYKEIIERFPHSNEKEYALVHLERIAKLKGNPNDPDYRTTITRCRSSENQAPAAPAPVLPQLQPGSTN